MDSFNNYNLKNNFKFKKINNNHLKSFNRTRKDNRKTFDNKNYFYKNKKSIIIYSNLINKC